MTNQTYRRLANHLTMLRMVLAVIFIAVMQFENVRAAFLGLVLFVVASITDIYDGRLARLSGLKSNFGIYFDALADKILVSAALIICTASRYLEIPTWMVIVVIAREFTVTGIRVVAASQGKVLAADRLGKAKAIVQMLALVFILFVIVIKLYLVAFVAGFQGLPPGELLSAYPAWDLGLYWFYMVLMIALLILTLWSGMSYLQKNYHLVMDDY